MSSQLSDSAATCFYSVITETATPSRTAVCQTEHTTNKQKEPAHFFSRTHTQFQSLDCGKASSIHQPPAVTEAVPDPAGDNEILIRALNLFLSDDSAREFQGNQEIQDLIQTARGMVERTHSYYYFSLTSQGDFIAKSCWDLQNRCKLVEHNTVFQDMLPSSYFLRGTSIDFTNVFPLAFKPRCKQMQERLGSGMVESISMFQRYWNSKHINIYQEPRSVAISETVEITNAAYTTAFVEYHPDAITGVPKPRFIKLFSNFQRAPPNVDPDDCFLPLVVRLRQRSFTHSRRHVVDSVFDELTDGSDSGSPTVSPYVPHNSSPDLELSSSSSPITVPNSRKRKRPAIEESGNISSAAPHGAPDMQIWGGLLNELKCVDTILDAEPPTSLPNAASPSGTVAAGSDTDHIFPYAGCGALQLREAGEQIQQKRPWQRFNNEDASQWAADLESLYQFLGVESGFQFDQGSGIIRRI